MWTRRGNLGCHSPGPRPTLFFGANSIGVEFAYRLDWLVWELWGSPCLHLSAFSWLCLMCCYAGALNLGSCACETNILLTESSLWPYDDIPGESCLRIEMPCAQLPGPPLSLLLVDLMFSACLWFFSASPMSVRRHRLRKLYPQPWT